MTNESTDERRKAVTEALEKCSETVNRAMVSLLAVSLFCLLTTFGAADRSLIAPEASIKVPFAEVPISFVGFLIVAPLLLVILTIYLHVFYGYWRELDAERRAQGLTDTYPTLFSIDRRVGRLLTAFIFYWLTPLALAAITWKAAARFEWGLPVALATVLLTAGLLFLQARRRGPPRSPKMHAVSLRLIALLMLAAAASGVVTYVDFLYGLNLRHGDYHERPLDLFRADLKDAWLVSGRFKGATLSLANLRGVDLSWADLREAVLVQANLSGAVLLQANLGGATLSKANLADADLRATVLSKANLRGANLSGADIRWSDLSGADLQGANLSRANLGWAKLMKANLGDAHLDGVDLIGANLSGAKLGRADLQGANLGRADLSGADLTEVDLSHAEGLTCDQVHAAKTDKATKLPGALQCEAR